MKFLNKVLEMLNKKDEQVEPESKGVQGREYILDVCALHSNETMQIIEKASKIILLTGTIKELDDHKNAKGILGNNIRKVGRESWIDQNGEKYQCVAGYEKKINKKQKYQCINGYTKYKYQDDNIIDYCKEHKGIIILTCDNNLCNTAKAYNIPYIFPKRTIENKKTSTNSESSNKQEAITEQEKTAKVKNTSVNIHGTEYINGNLYIDSKETGKVNLVLRNGNVINDNSNDKIKLEIGDYVIKLKKRNERVIIVKYKIENIAASFYAAEIGSANVNLDTIKDLTNKFPKEVMKNAGNLLQPKEKHSGNGPRIYFQHRWINVEKNRDSFVYINVERQGKSIKTQHYAEGDLLYISKYNKKQNNLEIYVYRIIKKENEYSAQEINQYKIWLVNEIYNIKMSEEIQEQIRMFFVKYARY